jgi:glycosyltransferase involved in cell wall biosynthesis
VSQPVVSVVIPTRDRAGYLRLALESLAKQNLGEPWEVLVVDDGSSSETGSVAEAGGATVLASGGRGLNAARNAGIRAARAELVALTDDDVVAPPGWLRAVVEGAKRHHDSEAFGGPIQARLEGPAPRSCGREAPPITALDLGQVDRGTDLVWGANMALRRAAFERVGPFDESIHGGGDEEDWLRRLRESGGRVTYLAGAGLVHRRAGDDVRLRALVRGAYRRGRRMRAWDRRRGAAPGVTSELRTLAGCGWHTVRRACPQGIVMGAHSLGRTVEAVRPR